ncbi:MAG: response regulator transcription factor [Sporichthyaceae bacterium]|nr:response regulator transcription factor [Sporichthyaceae bacterium]
MRPRILVAEDDPTISEVVERYLKHDGYDVECVSDGPTALHRALVTHPDLVVLDIMLPGLDGLEVCRRLRASTSTPVILLTALGSEGDRIAGLEHGADDYITKPFSPRELALRVRAVLRRAAGMSGPPSTGVVQDGDLRLDRGSRLATLGEAEVQLTTREFDLLSFLMDNRGRVFDRPTLLSKVWGWDFGDQSTVTVHVRRLRAKIERDAADPKRIVTVWGTGYRYEQPVAP